MRFAAWLIALGLLGAALGVATAHASGAGTARPADTGTTSDTTTTATTDTTTTETTTTPSTTTATTTTESSTTTTTETITTTETTTTTPTTTTVAKSSRAVLPTSSLRAKCVGGGVAAVRSPSGRVVALGASAKSLGPAGYPASFSIITVSSADVRASTCRHRTLTLSSLSLFRGAVTARRIEATDGNGSVVGLAVAGVPVQMKTGTTVAVKGWGVLSRGATLGRIRTPLVLRLLKAHGSLPAGTQIAIAFTASPRHLHQRNGHFKPVNFPVAASPFVLDGGLTKAARDNPVIAIASRYLGIPYVWGGSSPNPGFDCSGLVQYVYAKLGVSFVHFAASQYTSPNTVSVPPQRLAAGDLVFFVGSDGTREAPGHVGIYVQDGYFIDAPHTGSVVRVDSLADPEFAGQYIGARRVVAPLQLHHFHLTTLLTSVVGKGFIPHLFRKFLKAATYVIDRSTAGYRSDGEIAVVGVSGGSLLLILGGGTALVVRRRRREPADST